MRPVLRPGTESNCCAPGPNPRRSKGTLSLFATFSHTGGRRLAGLPTVVAWHRYPARGQSGLHSIVSRTTGADIQRREPREVFTIAVDCVSTPSEVSAAGADRADGMSSSCIARSQSLWGERQPTRLPRHITEPLTRARKQLNVYVTIRLGEGLNANAGV